MPRAQPGQRFGGRKKGTRNKVTVAAKDAILQVATELGGAEGLLAWVRKDDANAKIFWGTVYPKLLPLQVAGDASNPLRASIEISFVKPGAE